MANFFEALPYSVTYNGKKYKLTPAYDNVLRMYQEIEDCTTAEQVDIMLYYLLKSHRYPLDVGLLQAICNVLFPAPKRRGEEKSFDYIQDSEYIYAAFMQAYGIDLQEQRGKMHWWKFNALMQGLPSDTKLAEIISIRMRPLPKATKANASERQQLIRLKQSVALKLSEEERQRKMQNGLAKMAQAMLQMAKKNGEKEV